LGYVATYLRGGDTLVIRQCLAYDDRVHTIEERRQQREQVAHRILVHSAGARRLKRQSERRLRERENERERETERQRDRERERERERERGGSAHATAAAVPL
jgi:sulfite reductase beta subunit-like hemoprotein